VYEEGLVDRFWYDPGYWAETGVDGYSVVWHVNVLLAAHLTVFHTAVSIVAAIVVVERLFPAALGCSVMSVSHNPFGAPGAEAAGHQVVVDRRPGLRPVPRVRSCAAASATTSRPASGRSPCAASPARPAHSPPTPRPSRETSSGSPRTRPAARRGVRDRPGRRRVYVERKSEHRPHGRPSELAGTPHKLRGVPARLTTA
jgi:hypothetical protein